MYISTTCIVSVMKFVRLPFTQSARRFAHTSGPAEQRGDTEAPERCRETAKVSYSTINLHKIYTDLRLQFMPPDICMFCTHFRDLELERNESDDDEEEEDTGDGEREEEEGGGGGVAADGPSVEELYALMNYDSDDDGESGGETNVCVYAYPLVA